MRCVLCLLIRPFTHSLTHSRRATPETALATAVIHAERLRELILAQPAAFEDQVIAVTASFGVAQWHYPEDAQALLGRADSLLYQAKADGRNRVYPPQNSGTDLRTDKLSVV